MAGYLQRANPLDEASATTADYQATTPAAKEAAAASDSAPLRSGTPNFQVPEGAVVNRGLIQGYLAAQENRRADNADIRAKEMVGIAQSDAGIRQETQDWRRTNVQQQEAIRAGMMEAAKDGGYEGVIDYLKVADPTKAMEFTKSKTELDRSLMQTDVMKAAMPGTIAKVQAEAYGALGSMGAALLKSAPADREAMYQNMLPMVKAINPNAPKALNNDAIGMFMLAAAQATPVNQLFKSNQQALTAQSQLGKLDLDIRSRMAAGVSPDDPTIKALIAKRDQTTDMAQQAQLNNTVAQLDLIKSQGQIDQQKVNATEKVNQNLNTGSKDFLNFVSVMQSTDASRNALTKDPANSQAQQALARGFAKAYNSGSLTDKDVAIAFSAVGLPDLQKKFTSMISGNAVNLNPTEVGHILSITKDLETQKLQYQQAVENQFKQQTSTGAYQNLVDWNNIRRPSEMYMGYKDNASPEAAAPQGQAPAAAIQYLQANPQFAPQFQAKYGYNPLGK